MSVFLAIDLGTTGCRSILLNEKLEQLAYAYEEYGLITPKEDWVEQDANLWWDMTLRTAKEAISKAGISGQEIKSISISSQGITLVPVDNTITPLCNAINWLDQRAKEQAAQIEQDFGNQAIYTMTGKNISPSYSLSLLLWIKQNLPEIYQKTWKFLMPMDFLIAKFTGRCVTDHSMASGTLMYDLKNFCWSRDVLDFYHIDEATLPEIVLSGEKAGVVLPEVAKELGLSADCMVAVGAQDQKCAAYGVGLCDGVMTVSLGTAGAVTKLWTTAHTETNTGIGWCGYVLPNTFVTEGVINTAGTCLRWVRNLMFAGENYKTIDQEALAAKERSSSLLFYPYLSGASSPHFYPESTGCFYGMNLATERGDFALAVMEGIAYQLRILLETMEAYKNVHTLILFGGGASSSLWCQLIADITGMRIVIPKTHEAAGAGATMLAAKAIGEMLSPLETAIVYAPSEETKAYEEKYKKYRAIEKKLWEQEATNDCH